MVTLGKGQFRERKEKHFQRLLSYPPETDIEFIYILHEILF